MRHPLVTIPAVRRKPFFWVFLCLTVLMAAIFRVLDVPLRTDAAPNGIVSFELAGTTGRAGEMLASWGALSEAGGIAIFQPTRTTLAFSLGFDYLFMPVYALTSSLAVLLAAGEHGAWGRAGAWTGWAALAAPVFDAVENYALLQLALGKIVSPWPQTAAVCATIKFALLAAGILFALCAWLVRASASIRNSRSPQS